MDDVQFLNGKEQTQEAFFHTFNDLHTGSYQIVMTSDRPPKALTLTEDRLRSRYEWGLIADIQPPDLETRIAILAAKADDLQIAVEPPVLELIAKRVQKNVRELEGSLNRVVAYAQLLKRPHHPGIHFPPAGRYDPWTPPATPLTRSASWNR